MSPESSESLVWRRWLASPAVLGLLLAALAFAVYWPVLSHDFINYDDPEYFSANAQVRNGLSPAGVSWAFTTMHAGNWHPLTWLSLMLDASLFGQGSFGPHLTNVLLHCANAVMLFLWLRHFTGFTRRCLFVAALFALHPLHVESVAWISERKDVLSTFFGLLALWSYTATSSQASPEPGASLLRYRCSLLFFALSLMSKPMFVTLPALLILLDVWPLRRADSLNRFSGVKLLVLEKWPFLLLSLASAVVTFIAQKKGGAVTSLVNIPFVLRLENTFVSVARYLGKTFWPSPLAIPYPYSAGWDTWFLLFAVALVVGLCAIAWLYRRRFPFALTGWLWFLITLIPVIGIVQVGNQSMADRYTYIPLIGIFIACVWLLAELRNQIRLPDVPSALIAVGILIACSLQTRQQIGFWRNSGTLFSHAIQVTENNFVACNNLGTWLSGNGRLDEALECFQRSLRIKPDNPDALYNAGNVFARVGEWDQAISLYRAALKSGTPQPDMLNNLGFALAATKQYDEAIAAFLAALKLDRDSANAHNNLAAVYYQANRLPDAIRQYREAVRLSPDDPRIWVNLGDAQARLDQKADAAESYRRALRLNPGDPRVEAKLKGLEAR